MALYPVFSQKWPQYQLDLQQDGRINPRKCSEKRKREIKEAAGENENQQTRSQIKKEKRMLLILPYFSVFHQKNHHYFYGKAFTEADDSSI